MPKTKNTTAHAHLRSGRWIQEKRRFAIYLRDGMRCAYCGESVEAAIGTAGCSLDHVVPDGGNHESNLVTSCKNCNDTKGGASAESFCSKETLARINDLLSTPIDEAAGKAAHEEWKAAKSGSDIPPLPALTFRQMHSLLGMTSDEFGKRVEAGELKPSGGSFEIVATVRAALRAARSGTSGNLSDASLKLAVAREEQIRLDMEVTRKERIPLDVIEAINDRALSNVAGLMKAHEGKTLDTVLIGDIFTELRTINEHLKDGLT
jgi:HNH endonuclease